MDRGAHPSRHHRRAGSVEFAVEMQESQGVDETPDRDRHRFLIGAGKALSHNGADVLRDGGGRRDPFTAVARRARRTSPEQCRVLEREPFVDDGESGQVIRGVDGRDCGALWAISLGQLPR